MSQRTQLAKTFVYCLNILRDNEHLTGDKALRTLAHLLDLRLLEPKLEEIGIDTYDYNFEGYPSDKIDLHKKTLLKLTRFSNIAKEKETNIPHIMKYVWNDILSAHPVTKHIFLKDNGFDIQNQSSYKKIIDRLITHNFEEMDEDILGEVYEEVIKDVMIGKVLGQFFTPPSIKKIMIDMVKPQLNDDGTIETIFDPAMGTGGFLITSLRSIMQQSRDKSIDLDWDFIIKHGIGGREAEPDTFQLAISNMLISSGHLFTSLEKGDSIRNPIKNKYDIVLANPPFGIDGLIYDEILDELRNEYMPIKTNCAVGLFLQAIIYMLNTNGRCAIVLPNGKEMWSKTSKDMIHIRELLMKTCEIIEIYYLPENTFTHTSVDTCILHFVKRKSASDILEITERNNKNYYKFKKTHCTTKIRFQKNDIVIDVPIEEICSNHYSLDFQEYMKDKEEIKEGVKFVSLGEICEIIPGKKQRSKDGLKTGLYPLFYCSILGHLYLDTYDYEGEGIIINKTNGSGKAMVYYGSSKYNVGETTIHFKTKNNVLTKYVYYYLKYNIPKLERYYKGANQKSITENDLFKIRIPIPSLDAQKKIVSKCEYLDDKNKKLELDIQENIKKQESMFL